MQMFGFGARTIAFVDTTVTSPFAELSMIPALTIVAINAPAGRRATWFALMASLMNVALVAGAASDQISQLAVRDRPRLLCRSWPRSIAAALLIGFVVPVAGILAFGKRAT